jgi:AraC-like DNA-binding protein/beta-xylosidase
VNAHIIHVGEYDHPVSPDYQFYLLQKGSFTVFFKENLEKYTLQKQDIIMVKPDAELSCTSYQPNTVISIRIDKSFIDGIIPFQHELICNSIVDKTNTHYAQLADIMLQICSSYFTLSDKSVMIPLIYELTSVLQHSFMHKITEDDLPDTEDHNQDRVHSIIDYLQSHYHQSLSLNTLADEMYLTPQYLSKFIKKNLGSTFSAYLTDIRLEHAMGELLHTDHSVTNIALGNGFPNIAAFNRIFRQKYNVSPSHYRQQYQASTVGEQESDTLLTSEDEPNNISQTTNIHVVLQSLSPYQKPWQDTINIGPLSNALKNSFHTYFGEYAKSVPVKYVRFYNMFSDDILAYGEESDEFNFDNLDVILDFFHHLNVVPFVELSYKPAKGYVSMDSSSSDGIFADEKELSYYYKALSATLRHCLNSYGSSYMSQWRFEVWMKYDEDLTALESSFQYSKKFMGFHRIVKELLPKCMIGGPCFNMSGRFQDFMMLITNLEQLHLPFDFISLCAYSYKLQSHYEQQDLSTIGIISPDPGHIIHNFRSYKSYIRKNAMYHQLPVFITEFGSTVSMYNHVTESVFQAAFLCQNMIGLLGDCSCIAYSFFIDTMRTVSLTQSTFSFSGLISENGIPKPSLHAFALLNRLGKNLISMEKNYIMTSNSANRYQLLCFHYTHFSKSYCFNSWDNVKLEDTYEIFTDEPPVDIHFTCEGLPLGRYKVTQFSLNRNYGSALDKYLRILDRGNTSSIDLLSTIMNLREDETDYFKQTSIPRQDIYYLLCEPNLELDISLESHEIVFYDFSRIL